MLYFVSVYGGCRYPRVLWTLCGGSHILHDRVIRAHISASKGDYAVAEPFYQAALAGCRQVLGDTHPDTLTSMDNLAILYQAKGDYAVAEPLYQSALAGCRQAAKLFT